MIKIPTAKDDDEGVGSGKVDFRVRRRSSARKSTSRSNSSGYGGIILRGDPDDIDLSNGFRWGFGAGFPTRSGLRVTAELHGESASDSVVTYTGSTLIGDDGSLPPTLSDTDSPANFAIGVTWIGKGGMFAGAASGWRLNMDNRGVSARRMATSEATHSGSRHELAITRVSASTSRRHRHRHRRHRRQRRHRCTR